MGTLASPLYENRRETRLKRELAAHRNATIDKGVAVEESRLYVVVELVATVGTDGMSMIAYRRNANTCDGWTCT